MLFGELYEFIHVWADCFHATLHGGNAVALSLEAYALSHDGSELAVGYVGCSTAMHPFKVAAKDEYLARLKFCN